MQIWYDGFEKDCIELGSSMGILSGVTTNPTLLAKSSSPWETVQELLCCQEGAVAVQVTAASLQSRLEQGRWLSQQSPRILVKIPVDQEGMIVIRTLSQEGIPTLGTAVYTPEQALLAAAAGARFLAPYLRKDGGCQNRCTKTASTDEESHPTLFCQASRSRSTQPGTSLSLHRGRHGCDYLKAIDL